MSSFINNSLIISTNEKYEQAYLLNVRAPLIYSTPYIINL